MPEFADAYNVTYNMSTCLYYSLSPVLGYVSFQSTKQLLHDTTIIIFIHYLVIYTQRGKNVQLQPKFRLDKEGPLFG